MRWRPLAALAAAQVASSRVPERWSVATTRTIVLSMLAVSALDASRARRGLAGMAAAGAIGLAAEHLGTRTGRPFGAYSYSERLGPRVGGVPLLAAAAWAMMARPAWVVAGLIDERDAVRVPLAAGALTAWDVFLDPRMAREGYWHWPAGGRYEGIPASNFAGWLATGAVVFSAWSLLDVDHDPADEALGLYVWTWVGETVANAIVWRRPVTAGAGSVAMGLFAVPALRRRLSAGAC